MGFLRSKEFSRSGPKHLIAVVNWTNDDHRRSVTASLVQGVYVMERDRQKKRKGPKAHAPPWWESFNFEMLETLTDGDDIFGAIYKFESPAQEASNNNLPTDGIPRYVIAFRGTLIKRRSFIRDMKSNFHIYLNDLHRTSRLKNAIKAVRNKVDSQGSSNVWLAGHSLGAAIALVAGKTMAKTGVFLQSFLFNSPFLPDPIERIKDEEVKRGIQSVINNIFARDVNHNNLSADPFLALSPWVPCLYVNPADRLCSEYIGYFKNRKLEEIGAGGTETVATQQALGCPLRKESEPIHLIPSANLTVNLTASHGFEQPHEIFRRWRRFQQDHGIAQWWRPDLKLEAERYTYK